MFNSTSMRASDNSRPGKKHKRSSSELTVGELEFLTRGLEDIRDKIKHVKASLNLSNLEDEASNAIHQVKVIQNLKRKDENAVVISLSHVDEDILSDRLGVQQTSIIDVDCSSPVIFLDKLLPALKAQPASNQLDHIAHLVTHRWNSAPLLDTLSTVEENVNKTSEAASRIIIDAWLLHGIRLIKSMNNAYQTVLFPELLIWARNSESDDPPEIRYRDQTTYLVGSVDYALLSVLPHENDPVSEKRIHERLLGNDNAARTLHFFSDSDILNIYEAKRPSQSLEVHEAQVIAQCLAIMAKCNASSPNYLIHNLAFTLTSGAVWIFGVVDLEGRACIRTTEIRVDVNDMKGLEDRSVQSLMTLIMIWSTQPADVIKAAMNTLRQ